MLRCLLRFVAGAGVALALVNPLWAQMPQQRTDDLGIMSTPQGQQSGPATAPIQQINPLQTAPVQSPTITNNPDYPRQPIFVPAPYMTPFPGQIPGQFPQ